MRRTSGTYRAWLVAEVIMLLCLSLAAAPLAYANFGPHAPGAAPDSDSCAMCHRSHTSFSSAGWADLNGNEHISALIVGSASNVSDYCLVCHGDGAPGAATNVMSGLYEGGPSELTSSTTNAPLNAGGFASMPDPYVWEASATVVQVPTTSSHNLEVGPLPLWGAGAVLQTTPSLSCVSCHDPHPTSNYRMLRGQITTHTVGGYTGVGGDTPNAFVFSTETGYPIPGVDASNTPGGFLKGAAGQAQVDAYRPNYTGGTPLLSIIASDTAKSLSVWCSSCHTGYRQRSATTTVVVDYGLYEANPLTGIEVGPLGRHFHPSDITLERGYGPNRTLPATIQADQYWAPLEKAANNTSGEYWKNYIGCATCHRAHGSSRVMTGWAASHLETNSAGAWMPVQDTTPGVSPDKLVAGGSPYVGSSALLRTDNRGVCERCHGTSTVATPTP
ncbi:MAG: hypothetical protein WCI74_15585 [Actinomycetes bacterium]